MQNSEIRYFTPDKKSQKNTLLIFLIVLSAIVAVLIFVLPKRANQPTQTVWVPPLTQDNVFRNNRVEVSDTDSNVNKSDINILVEDELRLNLTTDDEQKFMWILAKDFDRQVLNLDEVKFHSVKQNVALSESYERWRFTGTQAGGVQLTFVLLDLSQERKIVKSETFQVRVR